MDQEREPATGKSIIARRATVVAGGLAGAVGVMSAAAASHSEASRNLSAIAAICLAHGPALLALGLAGRGRLLDISAILLAGGTAIFAADLGVREWLGHGLFAGAAPLGGFSMIAGWCITALAGIGIKRSNH